MKKLMFVLGAVAAVTSFAEVPYEIGIARFTMHKKGYAKTLEFMQAMDCHQLGFIEGSLARDASAAEIASFKENAAKYGVEIVTAGPLYCSGEEEVAALFKFAKNYGLKSVSVVPFELKTIDGQETRVESDAMLDVVEKYVKEYDIKACVHNHGPDIKYLFPTAESVWARIKDRDPRLGFCLDVGHQRRAGNDPVEAIKKYAERIYEVHLKNILIDPVKNLAMPGPRGELDIPAIMTALAEIGFTGPCLIEYEKDFENNELPLAESLGYYKGVAAAIKVAPKMKPAPADANTLTAAEKADGWQLLWDGKTSAGWVSAKDVTKFPAKGWVMKDGTLTMLPVRGISPDRTWMELPPEDAKLGGGGDIVTVKKYKDFAFKFDFRLTKGANSGVKYFIDETQNGGSAGEYQILENFHPDSDKGVDGNRKSASLYDVISAHADKIQKGIGQWNTGMIVAKGSHVEHWLNGEKVLEYERGSEAFRSAVNKSKYATWGKTADGKPQPWGEIAEGRILLQDHSDSTVSFCNLKIKEL